MEKRVRDDTLAVLRAVRSLLETEDATAIAELSNHTIHNASIYQDEVSLSCAVIVYALSKTIARSHNSEEFTNPLKKLFEQAITTVDNEQQFQRSMNSLIKFIESKDEKLHLYIEEVIHKAKVNKGSALFKHGISIGRAAELLGITPWDLQNYIGNTSIIDDEEKETRLRKKIILARSLFP